MCVMSAVMDHYNTLIPTGWQPFVPLVPPPPPGTLGIFTVPPGLSAEIAEMRVLIAEFKEATAAAKRIDVLTKQPNCEDPEKIALVARVAELEARLDAVSKAIAPPA